MKIFNVDQMRTIMIWWLFYQQDRMHVEEVIPETYKKWIDEAVKDPAKCDAELVAAYDEYVSQVTT